MALRPVEGKPGSFFDEATGKEFSIRDLREDDKYETVKLGGFWWWVKRIVWMVLHPWDTIRSRIERAYFDRLLDASEDAECPVCERYPEEGVAYHEEEEDDA